MENEPLKLPETISSETLLKSPFWEIYYDKYRRYDDSVGEYVLAHSPCGATITILRTPSNQLLLIKVYRYPAKRWMWEFVAGGVESGETPEQCAVREVREEIGLKINSAKLLGEFVPLTGLVSSKFFVCLAEIPEVKLADLRLQREEHIAEARLFGERELAEAVQSGTIECGGTLVALGMYWAHRFGAERGGG